MAATATPASRGRIGLAALEGLYDDLVAVVGPHLPRLLKACQRHYEDMVNARLGRRQNLVGDLRELRSDLRWYIVQYNNAVITLARREQPETLELLEQALRAVISVRRAFTGSSGLPSAEDLDELDELLGEHEPESEPAPESQGPEPESEPAPEPAPEDQE